MVTFDNTMVHAFHRDHTGSYNPTALEDAEKGIYCLDPYARSGGLASVPLAST